MSDDLLIPKDKIDPKYLAQDNPDLWTEDKLEEYAKKHSHGVSDRSRGTYTICDIHRLIYHKILSKPETLVEKDVQAEVIQLLEQAFVIAKKTDARLRMYKHDFDEGWWEEEKNKHEEWMKELKR
jgi:GH35 family endo-1,4-beta-xylanase